MTKLLKLSLIETNTTRGNGTTENPFRSINQLYTEDGELVLEYDPTRDQTSMVVNFIEHLGWIKK